MSKELTPEELLKQIWDLLKSFNILWMTNYMWCDPSIYNVWKKRKVFPYRNAKRIVEYIDMHCVDCIDLCWKLMDYYKREDKKRSIKLEASKERNRQRARERSLSLKENKWE